jgi:putative oxidoreductase
MIDPRTAPYAALLLRLGMGVLFLAHDALKVFVFGPAGTIRFFGGLGLPPAVAWLAIVLELVAGVALILGVWTRVVALVMIPHLLATIWFVHGSKGWLFSAPGGGWEFPAFWALALLALALLGDGAHALVRSPSLAGRGGGGGVATGDAAAR